MSWPARGDGISGFAFGGRTIIPWYGGGGSGRSTRHDRVRCDRFCPRCRGCGDHRDGGVIGGGVDLVGGRRLGSFGHHAKSPWDCSGVAAGAPPASITVIAGPLAGQTIPMAKGDVRMGRSAICDMVSPAGMSPADTPACAILGMLGSSKT